MKNFDYQLPTFHEHTVTDISSTSRIQREISRLEKQYRSQEEIRMNTLEYKIQNNESYWANPNNAYHDAYQRAINRRFVALLFVFVFSCIGAAYGLKEAVIFTLGFGVGGGVMVYVIYALVNVLSDMFDSFVDWINGY